MNDLLDEPDEGPAHGATLAGHASPPTRASRSSSDAARVAFTAFYRAETSGLVRFLIYLGAQLTDAADLAQDTMIDAFRQWSAIEQPRAWIRRVASRKYGRRLSSVELPIEAVDGRPLLSPGRDLAEWERHQEILRVLKLLPPRQRQVIAWTFDGYQPWEIAAELGISADAVRASLKLARRKLAELLDWEGDLR